MEVAIKNTDIQENKMDTECALSNARGAKETIEKSGVLTKNLQSSKCNDQKFTYSCIYDLHYFCVEEHITRTTQSSSQGKALADLFCSMLMRLLDRGPGICQNESLLFEVVTVELSAQATSPGWPQNLLVEKGQLVEYLGYVVRTYGELSNAFNAKFSSLKKATTPIEALFDRLHQKPHGETENQSRQGGCRASRAAG